MNTSIVTNFIKSIRSTATKHSPEILTGIGIAGMVTTTVLAVRATPKAMTLIEDKKEELKTEKLPVIETVKTTWKCYIPAVITGALSVSCLVGASATNLKRNAALATAYKLSETALSEYKDAVVETIGEKKMQDVKDKVAEKQLERSSATRSDVIVEGKGTTLCCEGFTGRRFYCDMDTLKKAENELNRNIINNMYQSLNDFYDLLGVEYSEMGDELGWNLDSGTIELGFSSQLTSDGRPCLVYDFNHAPEYNFSNFL